MEPKSLFFACGVSVFCTHTSVCICSLMCVHMKAKPDHQVSSLAVTLLPWDRSPIVPEAHCLGYAVWKGISEDLPTFTPLCWNYRDMQLHSAFAWSGIELRSSYKHSSHIPGPHISNCFWKSPSFLMSSGSWDASGLPYVLPGRYCWLCTIVLFPPLKTTGPN